MDVGKYGEMYIQRPWYIESISIIHHCNQYAMLIYIEKINLMVVNESKIVSNLD